jgi:uncharacterized protein (DUF1778 family)
VSQESPRVERTKRLCVRVAPEEEELWKEAAWLERQSLSDWLRALANQAAARRVEKEERNR